MKQLLVTCFVLILFSCQKPNPNISVSLIGHAGSGLLNNKLQPNSKESIKNALLKGADGVEVDLQITLDSIGVLHHDIEQFNGKYIHQSNYSEIEPFNISSLNEIGSYISSYDSKIYLDLKVDMNIMNLYTSEGYIEHVISDFIERFDLSESQVIVISRNAYLLGILDGMSIQKIYESDDFEEQINSAILYNFDGLLLKKWNYIESNIDKIKNENLIVGCTHSGTYQGLVRSYNLAPDFIILEDIKKIQKIRNYGKE